MSEFSKRINEVQRDIPHGKLGERLRHDENPASGEPLPEKTERFALIAPLVANAWDEIKFHRPEVLEERLKADAGVARFHAHAKFLDDISGQIDHHIEVGVDAMARKIPDTPNMNRLSELVKKGNFTNKDTPDAVIRAAFNTAKNVSMKLLVAAIQLYAKKYHEPIPEQTFRALAEELKPVIRALASSRINVFSDLARKTNLQNFSTKTKGDFWAIDPGLMNMTEKDKNPHIEINGKIVSILDAENLIENPTYDPRLGCPALFAKNREGKSVMDDFHDWVTDIFTKHYLPVWNQQWQSWLNVDKTG